MVVLLSETNFKYSPSEGYYCDYIACLSVEASVYTYIHMLTTPSRTIQFKTKVTYTYDKDYTRTMFWVICTVDPLSAIEKETIRIYQNSDEEFTSFISGFRQWLFF